MLHMRRAADMEANRQRVAVFHTVLRAMEPLNSRTILEIGAGCGANVPYFLGWGFRANAITLNELSSDLAARARVLFPAVRMVEGDAAELELEPHDVVVASTVFTSVLEDEHRARIARTVWRLTKPGGGVLLYDFTWNNPANPNVRKLTVANIRDLFPEARSHVRRVTLAPPIARHVGIRIGRLLHSFPWLRTHVVCWLPKEPQV